MCSQPHSWAVCTAPCIVRLIQQAGPQFSPLIHQISSFAFQGNPSKPQSSEQISYSYNVFHCNYFIWSQGLCFNGSVPS